MTAAAEQNLQISRYQVQQEDTERSRAECREVGQQATCPLTEIQEAYSCCKKCPFLIVGTIFHQIYFVVHAVFGRNMLEPLTNQPLSEFFQLNSLQERELLITPYRLFFYLPFFCPLPHFFLFSIFAD